MTTYYAKDANGNQFPVTPTPIGPQASAGAICITPASDAVAEPGGAAITGASMPSGGSGLTGWLSAIWQKLSGTLAVSASSLPLPSGAATSANQPALNADGGALAHVTNFPATQAVSGTLTSNDGGAAITGAVLPTGGSGLTGWLSAIWQKLSGTLAVSASSLPLPSGAATSANQPALNGDGGALAHVTNFPSSQVVSGSGAAGSPPVNNPVSISGFDGTNKQHIRTDSSGNVSVSDMQSAAFAGAVALTVGTSYGAQRSVGVLCTAAGNVTFQFPDASTLTLPVFAGWQTFPFACVQIVSAGTTATATYFNLK